MSLLVADCSRDCLRCYGVEDCSVCDSATFLKNNYCVTVCGQGYMPNMETRECQRKSVFSNSGTQWVPENNYCVAVSGQGCIICPTWKPENASVSQSSQIVVHSGYRILVCVR